MSQSDNDSERTAKDILSLGQQAWSQGNSPNERDRLVQEQTLALVADVDNAAVEKIRECIQRVRQRSTNAANGMSGKAAFGSMPSGIPNSALEVPQSALHALDVRLAG